MSFKNGALVLLLLCLSFWTQAQLGVSTTSYLANKYSSNINLPYSNTVNFIKNTAEGLPIIDGYELRTETDEFDLEQQEYLLRFNFNSGEERKAYSRILASNASVFGAMQQEYIQDQLELDLNNIIDFYFSKSDMDIINKEIAILKDRELVLSKLLKIDSEVHLSSWLSNQDDILEIYEDSMKIQNEMDVFRVILFDNMTETDFDYSDMVSIEEIETICESIFQNEIRSTDVIIAQAEEQKAKAEYELEVAEGSSWLKFAQIQYQNGENRSLQQEVSLSTSITLPYSANNRMKKNDAAIEVLEAKNKRLISEEKDANEMILYKMSLKSTISEYRHLVQLIGNQKLEKTYKSYQKIQNLSPLVLLDLQKSILKYNSKLQDIKKDIYKIYLDILLKSGVLTQKPRINFLSSSMDQY